jgi:uncharacterized protein (TIGR03790 family)
MIGVSRFHRRARRCGWLAALGLTAAAWPGPAVAQTGENVLVVVNERSAESIQVGEYYARVRAVPSRHLVRVQTPVEETIERSEYLQAIERPVGDWLSRHGLQDQVLYIVLTRGVPLRIAGTPGREGTTSSVDSELTLLYRKLTGLPVPTAGRVVNPYFLDQKAAADARRFTRATADVYLVTRLDGFRVEDVLEMIDRGARPGQQGRIVLDERHATGNRGTDEWLTLAADRLRAMGTGDRVLLEVTTAAATTTDPVLGYYSWGSNDPANRRRRVGLQFAPGAIGAQFLSTDARTFVEPGADWEPGGTRAVGGDVHSLAGDLIRDGISGVAAHVAEPYLDGTIRPQILFPVYLGGFNLAEAFYLAMPFLSWQTVVVGDPLCAPFQREAIATADLHAGMDRETGLPATFSSRRLEVLSRSGMNPAALKVILEYESATARGDDSRTEALLLRATELEPRLAGAQLQLGVLYEVRKNHDAAIDRYRRAVAADPQNAVALNNLAYALAVHQQKPQEALPLAERAYRLSKLPLVADTVGWIHHLLGQNALAAPLLEQAAAGAADNADVLIHAATVHAALGDLARARKELSAALALDARLAARPDVKALQEKLKDPVVGGLDTCDRPWDPEWPCH